MIDANLTNSITNALHVLLISIYLYYMTRKYFNYEMRFAAPLIFGCLLINKCAGVLVHAHPMFYFFWLAIVATTILQSCTQLHLVKIPKKINGSLLLLALP